MLADICLEIQAWLWVHLYNIYTYCVFVLLECFMYTDGKIGKIINNNPFYFVSFFLSN